LSIVEAAYDVDTSSDAWALEVLRATLRTIGGAIGAFACVSRVPSKGTFRIDKTSVVSLGSYDEGFLAVLERHANARPGIWSHHDARGRGAARCILTSEITVRSQPTLSDDLITTSGQDGVNILATDLDGRGFLMFLAVPANSDVSPDTRRDLTRVAIHVLAAIRLRDRLVPVCESPPPSRVRGPSSLTEAERSAVTAAARGHTTKEIAYTFGISDATVRVLLMRAARRCGVQSRKELLSLWLRHDDETCNS
jgi:DNA-binding CsgD family transcriptional regulator